MRSPNRNRKLPNKLCDDVTGIDLKDLSRKVTYTGSPEHKDSPNPLLKLSNPKPRADATICPRHINDINLVTNWLREAIEKGVVSSFWEGNFPRYVWYKNDGIVYMGRLINSAAGEYKGFPLENFEWPKNIDKYYD